MKEIIVLRYTQANELDQVQMLYKQLKESFLDNPVICVPANVDLIFDCPLDQLYTIRDEIDQIIWEKEQKDG